MKLNKENAGLLKSETEYFGMKKADRNAIRMEEMFEGNERRLIGIG